jgi:hypothetical protein
MDERFDIPFGTIAANSIDFSPILVGIRKPRRAENVRTRISVYRAGFESRVVSILLVARRHQ